ncbi:MAG: endonuclease Q family protein [Candidatus Woesearchaeota archaeon]
MPIIADLHIHGKYSRATSKDLTLPNLEKYARIKGVNLLGTGDFTQPNWFAHIKESLTERDGIHCTKTGFPFLLTSEISLIYTQDGKGRRVHNILLAPNLEVVTQITDYLKTKGRVDYDGRPIFKIPCPEFVESLRQISKDIEIIPAHFFTPHFSVFGEYNQFSKMEDCFQDQTKHIHAIETGLSADPAMIWRMSQLDKYSLVSFSDSHSFWPWKIGREATIFDTELNYKDIILALKTKEGLQGTVEVDPAYGKYHWDGHRACNTVLPPAEARKNNNICPVCNKKLTIGVEHRVEELADRKAGFKPKDAKPYYSLLPLAELIAAVTNKGVSTQGTTKEYYNILKTENEFKILLETSEQDLLKLTSKKITDAILKNRKGEIKISPGYDGVYGKAEL